MRNSLKRFKNTFGRQTKKKVNFETTMAIINSREQKEKRLRNNLKPNGHNQVDQHMYCRVQE